MKSTGADGDLTDKKIGKYSVLGKLATGGMGNMSCRNVPDTQPQGRLCTLGRFLSKIRPPVDLANGETMDKQKVIATLNRIMELELAGVVRYTHYSLMIFGHARIPIMSWMRGHAQESLTHAQQAGELVTSLGGHPSLKIGDLLETEQHDIDTILRESLGHERAGLAVYEELLGLVQGKDVRLEEYARGLIRDESDDISEVEKMLRRPGTLEPAV